ncbi:hypothetical protein C8R43DRAFT_861812, partial [Mycena crocata]
MAGVPKGHTDWMMRRFGGRTTRMVFDRFKSQPFAIGDGLDQGDSGSVTYWGFLTASLARIDPDSALYIDDHHALAIGKTLVDTTAKLQNLVMRPDGVNAWGVKHNCIFS